MIALRPKKLTITRLTIALSVLLGLGAFSYNLVAKYAEESKELNYKERNRQLSSVYQSKVTTIVERYVPKERFWVEASVVSKRTAVSMDIPYMPKSIILSSKNEKLAEAINEQIAEVRIKLFLPPEIKDEARRQLSDVVTSELKLNRWRGDRVSLHSFNVSGAKSAPDVKPQAQVDQITNSSPPEKFFRGLGVAEKPWILALIVTVVLALIFVGILFTIRLLAQALFGVGTAIERVSSAVDRGVGIFVEKGRSTAASEADVQHAGLTGNQRWHGDRLSEKAESLKGQLQQSVQIDGRAEAAVFDLAVRYLSEEAEPAKAVVLLEMVGIEAASKVYDKLPAKYQDAIMDMAKSSSFVSMKLPLMVDVGEDFLTTMMTRRLRDFESQNSSEIEGKIVNMTDASLAKVCRLLSAEQLPRLFLFIKPERLSKIFGLTAKLDQTFANRAVWALMAMQGSEKKWEADNSLLQILARVAEEQNANKDGRFYGYIKDLLGHMPTELAEEIQSKLAETSESLGDYLKKHHITWSQYFEVNAHGRMQIMENLSNSEIGALLTVISDASARQIVLEDIEPYREPLVLEQMRRHLAEGAVHARRVFEKTQKNLVQLIREAERAPINLIANKEPSTSVPDEPAVESKDNEDGTQAA